MSVTITNKTKGKLPRLPFLKMKTAVLGEKYDLSVAFVNPRTSRKLNKQYRNKDNSTNILAFPFDDTEGEIVIDLAQARKDAPKFDRPYTNFVAFLFIHALFHLKGFDHGSTMEKHEANVRRTFAI